MYTCIIYNIITLISSNYVIIAGGNEGVIRGEGEDGELKNIIE